MQSLAKAPWVLAPSEALAAQAFQEVFNDVGGAGWHLPGTCCAVRSGIPLPLPVPSLPTRAPGPQEGVGLLLAKLAPWQACGLAPLC